MVIYKQIVIFLYVLFSKKKKKFNGCSVQMQRVVRQNESISLKYYIRKSFLPENILIDRVLTNLSANHRT